MDSFGNPATGQAESSVFTVAPPSQGNGWVCGSALNDFAEKGFSATNSIGMTEAIGWLCFSNGAVLYSPVIASTNWGVEMTFSVNPRRVMVAGGSHPELSSVSIMRLTDTNKISRVLRVDPTAIYLGNTKIRDLVVGGSSNTLTLRNDSWGINVGVNGCYVTTIPGFPLRQIDIGHLETNQSCTLNLARLVVVTNATTGVGMQSMIGSLSNAPVPELVLAPENCSNVGGLKFAWEAPGSDVRAIRMYYATASGTRTSAFVPSEYLSDGSFVPVTSYSQARDGEPGQVILEAVPYNLSGIFGIGSARMYRQDYPRSGGTVLSDVPIASANLTAWNYLKDSNGVNHASLPLPSVVIPDASLATGGDVNLVVATNGAGFHGLIASDGFQMDTNAFALTNGWSFSAYIRLGSFRGTFFKAVPFVGEPIQLTYNNGSVSLGGSSVSLNPNLIHHIRVDVTPDLQTSNRVAVSLFVDRSSDAVGATPNYPFTGVVDATFDATSSLQFGSLAYSNGADVIASVLPAPVSALKPILWTEIKLASMAPPLEIVTATTTGSMDSAWKYFANTETAVPAPVPAADGQFGLVALRGGAQPVDIAYINGGQLGTNWTFEVRVLSSSRYDDDYWYDYSPPEFVIADSGSIVKIRPYSTEGGALYRVVHTPEATRLYRNGWDVSGSTELSVATNAAPSSRFIKVVVPANHSLAFKNMIFLNGAIDSTDAGLTPVHKLFSTETASILPNGLADPEHSLLHFADINLSEPGDNRSWMFDATQPGTRVIFAADEEQVMHVYAPGDYGITLFGLQDRVLAALSKVQIHPHGQALVTDDVSEGLIATQAESDTNSVILVPHQRPYIMAEGGDRRVDLTLDQQPDDLQGYVLWQNDMGRTLGTEAVPVKFISRLGEHAVERIRRLASSSTNHPYITGAQKSGLTELPNQDLLAKSFDDVNLFFYHGGRSAFTVPVGGVKNATVAGQQYTFTFDPYDDALPHPSERVPTPNLGSRELGGNNIPATNVNTVSISVQTANQMPVFLHSGLVCSLAQDGLPLSSIRDINTNVAAWIQNNVDPDLVVVPGSWANTRLYFSGPLAADRTLSVGDVSIEGAGGVENQVADFSTTIDPDHADQPAVSDPFHYNKDMRHVELPLKGSFVVGQTLQEGENQFRCSVGDSDGGVTAIIPEIMISKDGVNSPSLHSAIIYDQSGPAIRMVSPSTVALGTVLVNGTYSDPSGIRRVTALLNGVECPIDTDSASLGHGVFWFKLANNPVQGTNDLALVAEDLVGNISTSALTRFVFRAVTVDIHASVRKIDANLFFSANITGLGEAGSSPAVLTLALNGDTISLTNLVYSGTTAMLTNWPVTGHSGNNLFMLKAGLAVGSAGEVDATVSGTAEIYLNQADTNQTPELPQLLSVHPAVTMPLYADNGIYTFDNSHPFGVDYYDRDPGVSPSDVRIQVRSGSGIWQDVSNQFVCTETRASLKAGGSFSITTNRAQIKLQVPEKNYPVPAEFILNYMVLDKALDGQPVLLDLNQFLFARDISRTVILEGQNLAKVTEVEFRSETNGLFAQRLRILDLQTNLTKSVGAEIVTYDALAVQVQPPLTGMAYFYLNGVRQDQIPVLIVDASSQKLIDDFVRSMRDWNGDGRIDIHDLDMNGDGLPDGLQVPIVEPAADRDGDGLPNWLDQYPDVVNSLFDTNADPLVNMAHLGFTGESGGTIVVVTPEVVVHSPGVVTLFGDTLDLVGLVVHGTTRVTLQFASGHEPVTACIEGPSGLYPSSDMEPLVFTASVALTRPPSGTNQVIVTADNGPGTPATSLSFGLKWHVNTPDITLGFAPGANPILGYHSLYNSLLVDGTMHMQSANLVEGIITHDDYIDVDTLEFRLDNEIISRDLFETWPSSGATTKQVSFWLKDNKRIDIYSRWQSGNLSQFLSIHNLVYGPHTLGVRVQDVNGKVGNRVSVFTFDHGKKLTIDVQNAVTRTDPVPTAPGDAGMVGTDAFNNVKARTGHSLTANPRLNAGLYGVTNKVGASIDYGDFASYPDYEKFVLGSDLPNDLVNGPVAVTLSGDPTYAGGALEQMLLNTQRVFKVSTSLPGDFEVPFSKTDSSVDGSIVTTTTKTWTYNVACSGLSTGSLDVTSLFQPSSDAFDTNGTLSLSSSVAITLNGPSNSTVTTFISPSEPSGGGGEYGPGPGSGVGDGGWGSGTGATLPPPVVRSASLTPPPPWKMVPVGGMASLSLNVGSGTYGPTNPIEGGVTSAGPCIDISGGLTNMEVSGTATLTARFPSIPGSMAGQYLNLAGTGDPNPGMYYYDMNYRFNYKFYVEGLAIGDSLTSLTTNSVEFAFLPVSDPYAAVAVDERTLLLTHQNPGDPESPAFLDFDLLIRDPLAFYAADPTVYPPKVAINGHWVSAAAVKYISDTELPGVYKVTISGQAIKVGENRLDFTVQNVVGSVTHASYIVELGDDDGLHIATPNDLYIDSQGARIGTVQQSKVYTQTVFGEFATPNYTITGSGLVGSSMKVQRDGRFGRNARPFYIIDNYPMEGSISLPASVQGASVAVQKPGGEVVWSTGSQNVTVYAEGVSIMSGGAPTHNLIPGEILTNSITLEAFVDAKRVSSGTPNFELQIFQADGAPVELGGGLSEIVMGATDAGPKFGGRGEKYEGSTPLEIVGSLPGGVRYMDGGGVPKIVLHDGEFIEARFAGLSTLAGALVKIDLDGDRNLNGDYADDEADEEKAPGLLVTKTDDASTSWKDGLVKVRLAGRPGGMNAGSVVLEATTALGGGQIKVWSTNTSPTSAALWLDTANGITNKTWALNFSSSMKDLPEWVYVQGAHISATSGDVRVETRYMTAGGASGAKDDLAITVLGVDLVPDFNHDRVIDEGDRAQISTNGPFRFWINDDADAGDVASGDSDLPGHGNWGTSQANFHYSTVGGRCDLLDFTSVWLDLSSVLQLFPPNLAQYKLKQANDAVKMVYTDLTKQQVGDFLIAGGQTYGPLFNRFAYDAPTFKVTATGVSLSPDFLNKIKNDPAKGVLLMEGAGQATTPLVLEVWYNGCKVYTKKMPLSLDGVEKMYRTVNLRNMQNAVVSLPSNYPDSLSNGKNVVFLHGYQPDFGQSGDMRAWLAEVFKRHYQSGSRAKFHGVLWFSNQGDPLDYQKNVANAFMTAPLLKNYVDGLNGEVVMEAHSLGNMVVSSAIVDQGMFVSKYMMCDAAVASEAYDITIGPDQLLVNEKWLGSPGYSNRTWAANWYKLFQASGDSRMNLTWRDRFGDIGSSGTTVVDFFSSGDEVFSLADSVWFFSGALSGNFGRHSWQKQEVFKGWAVTSGAWSLGGTMDAGWGFEGPRSFNFSEMEWEYEPIYDPAAANVASDEELRNNPVFTHSPTWLVGTQPLTTTQIDEMLAMGIPALTPATGRIEISGVAGQFNLNVIGNKPNGWPNRGDPDFQNWLHNDMKDVAYFFNYKFYDRLVNEGGLE